MRQTRRQLTVAAQLVHDGGGFAFEAMQKITASPLKKCPECGKATLQRLMSAPVFRLKGGGWYETDFKSEQDGKRNLADKPEADAPKEDKKDAKAGSDDAGAASGKDAAGKEGAGKEAGAKDAGGKDTGSKDTAVKDGKKALEKSADKRGDSSKEKSSDKASDKSGSKTTVGASAKRGSQVAKKSSKAKPVRKAVAKAKRRR